MLLSGCVERLFVERHVCCRIALAVGTRAIVVADVAIRRKKKTSYFASLRAILRIMKLETQFGSQSRDFGTKLGQFFDLYFRGNSAGSSLLAS